MKRPDVLLIESCNFEDFPVGGQLSFAKQMMKAFGNRLALVGVCTDDTPIGQWVKRIFDGVEYDFFPVGRWVPSRCKPIIPARITGYLQIKRYKKEIMSLGVKSVFIQAPETLMAVHNWGWDSACYRFAGVSNPVSNSRYRWARPLAGIFERKIMAMIKKVNPDVIIAAADLQVINEFFERTGCVLDRKKIFQFPTRVDTDTFFPMSKEKTRGELGIRSTGPIVVTSGRIHREKGWDLLLAAFSVFAQKSKDAHLYFVGDGQDRNALESLICEYGISHQVSITGFIAPEQVARYLAAADLYVVGSHVEGWSIAMLEALACGKPIVSTDVSGARDMIVEGVNGYIVEKRDPERFAEAMNRALALKDADKVSLGIADKYTLKNLARDLGMLWKPLA